MKKLALLSTVALLALTACSFNTSQESKSSSSEASSQKTTKTTTASSSSSSKEEIMAASLDPVAIANGDFTSIQGTWTNSDGHSLTFDETGLVDQGLEYGGASVTDYGTASSGVYATESPGGFLLEFIPAGVVLPDFTDSESGKVYSDDSDHKKDRLWAGQGLVSRGSEGHFYYRTK